MSNYSDGWSERLKARRKELGLSLRDLGARTGLSATFLSTLERGTANPTLESLRKVANALNIPLLQLTDSELRPNIVVRHEERRRLVFQQGQIEYEILTPLLTKKMVLFQVRATADQGNLVAQPLSEPTEECIIVLSGSLSVCIAGQIHELNTGDSIYFEGRDLQSIHVIGNGECVYISAITPPVF